MTNREWLNTLSDEQLGKIFVKARMMSERELDEQCIDINGEQYGSWMVWLQAEHITTADDDFREIGFELKEQNSEFADYEGDCGIVLRVGKHTPGTIFTKQTGFYLDKQVVQILNIARRKRNEMGW